MTSKLGFEAVASRIVEKMASVGYKQMPRSVAIGGIPFELPYALVGSEYSMDLVIVLDATGGPAQDERNYWQAERIAQALDRAGSRRPLSIIQVSLGASRNVGVGSLLSLGRVVPIDDPARIDELLAPVLPLEIEPFVGIELDPIGEIDTSMKSANPRDSRTLRGFVDGASSERSVRDLLTTWLDESFGRGGHIA